MTTNLTKPTPFQQKVIEALPNFIDDIEHIEFTDKDISKDLMCVTREVDGKVIKFTTTYLYSINKHLVYVFIPSLQKSEKENIIEWLRARNYNDAASDLERFY